MIRTDARNVAHQVDSPDPTTHRPGPTRFRSVGPPSSDAYLHIGETVGRLHAVTPRMAIGVNGSGAVMAGDR